MIGLWLKWEFLHLFTMLLTSRLPDNHFLFFSFLNSSLIESFAIICWRCLWDWRPPCCRSRLPSLRNSWKFINVMPFKGQIRVWIAVWIWPLRLTLLFLYCTSIKPFMDRAAIELASLCRCQLLLLLHDLSRTCWYHRSILYIASWSSVLKVFIHLRLPWHIIVGEWHV